MRPLLDWFTEEDYPKAIKWRMDSIAQDREEIVKRQKRIEKLESEIYLIKESMKKNLDGVSDIPKPILQKDGKSYSAKDNYNPTWSWYERAVFVLDCVKVCASAKEIVSFLAGSVEPGLRGDEKKQRKAQAAIINAMKPRIKPGGPIIAVEDEKEGLKYGLSQWATMGLLTNVV